MGGEKAPRHRLHFAMLGSPPRGRGKGRMRLVLALRGGITPAWAGKSKAEAGENACPEDHPRVGGEKRCFRYRPTPGIGSPPRGRGKALPCRKLKSPVGITPAWAGKRFFSTSVLTGSKDHPRVGGEKTSCLRHILWVVGSPPRGRGKGKSATSLTVSGGITPAWAGKRNRTSCWA